MRKLRLVAVIIFGAWGGNALYKYLSDDGKVFVSREKLPESETVTNVAEQPPVEVHETTSMDEYFAAHKDDVQEIIKKTITPGPDSMEEYFQAHKNDVIESVKEKIKQKVEAAQPELKPVPEVKQQIEEVPQVKEKPVDVVAVYKPASKKGCCKNYKAKYCVKIDHSRDNETPNEIIMRHFQ